MRPTTVVASYTLASINSEAASFIGGLKIHPIEVLFLTHSFYVSLPDTGERECLWYTRDEGELSAGHRSFRECGILKINNRTCITFPG